MRTKRKILIVVGTRPNIIKITRFAALSRKSDLLEIKIVHTGQHYDDKMASSFFSQLGVQPDFYLKVPPLSANAQVAHILLGLEDVCKQYSPDMIIAVGDVNSTLAAALSANKLGIRLAHLEAGLRSFDRSMPEEHNRVITDQLSDVFFVTEESGRSNLLKEGKPEEAIHFVGNTMIDTLVAFGDKIARNAALTELGLTEGEYVLMTMHRPSNVDSQDGLEKILSLIDHFLLSGKVVFPVHPRTLNRIREFGLLARTEKAPGKLILTEPKDYFAFQRLIAGCRFVVTDSGGVQEETTFLGVPCFTLRPNTERPSTIRDGTNQLVTFDSIFDAVKLAESSPPIKRIPPLWDGKSTERIITILERVLA